MLDITGYVFENGAPAYAASAKPSSNPHILYLPKFSQQHKIYEERISFAKPVVAYNSIERPDYKKTSSQLKR
jgi:hypothetical protein